MGHQRVGPGTVNTRPRLLKTETLTLWFARFVIKCFSPKALRPKLARTIVSLHFAEKAGLIGLLKSALSVAINLRQTNLEKLKPAHTDVGASFPVKQNVVYNLTTELGMYYANRVLVSNCDADRYLSVELANRLMEKVTPKSPETPKDGPIDLATKIARLRKRSKDTGAYSL
jgi:hypothetical protein